MAILSYQDLLAGTNKKPRGVFYPAIIKHFIFGRTSLESRLQWNLQIKDNLGLVILSSVERLSSSQRL